MKPTHSLNAETPDQGERPGKKKAGPGKQFQQIATSTRAMTNRQPHGQPVAHSVGEARTPARRPVNRLGLLLGLGSKDQDSANHPHQRFAPHKPLHIEQAPTIAMAPIASVPARPSDPLRPPSPKSTRPLDENTAASRPSGALTLPITEPPLPLFGMPPTPPPVRQSVSAPDGPATAFSPSLRTRFAKTGKISRGRALLLIALLCTIVVQGLTLGPTQFLGPQGWAYVLGGSQQGNNLFGNQQGHQQKAPGTVQATISPQQYIDTIIARMNLDQKLGQMMMVQFVGAQYPLELNEMLTRYYVGGVLLFAINQNIIDEAQVTSLIQDIQTHGKQYTQLPMSIAIDQEGGEVDRLLELRGPSPSAYTLGASGDSNIARSVGKQDGQDLARYGFNLNLAPVVDVNAQSQAIVNVQGRTYSSNPTTVTQMAEAYLEGLQEGGKVIGTLKHFPGLGNVLGDPHQVRTELLGDQATLEQTDWAPYVSLIKQGHAHAILVTHTFVPSIDADKPASLSPKIIQGILRDQMGFQGVVITDSLTMGGIASLYTPGDAAALAVEAGSDIILGAPNTEEVGEMVAGIKHAIQTGQLSEQRINESVQRILLMKYAAGLLPLPQS